LVTKETLLDQGSMMIEGTREILQIKIPKTRGKVISLTGLGE